MIWNNQDELNDLLLLTPQQWSAWIVLSVTDLIGAQLADVCDAMSPNLGSELLNLDCWDKHFPFLLNSVFPPKHSFASS